MARRPIQRLTLGLLAVLLATAAGAAVRSLPRLEVEAPPEHAALARELEALPAERFEPVMRMVGLERAGPPIRVDLATEDSPQADAAESWVAGYAYGALGHVVLFVERTPPYPDGSLEELLDHEVAHVLIARAAANRPVPRWFNEGVAMVAGHSWGLEDTSRLTLAMLTESEMPLEGIDRLFAGHSGEVARAYALSGALVRDLLHRFGSRTVATILEQVRYGVAFEEAFFRATGTTVAELEESFWNRHSFWYRWVPILGSSATIWLGVTLLALLAFRRRKQRDAEIRARWEREEERQEERERQSAETAATDWTIN
ncbi:MAG: hypothetical protein R3244_06785 [Thermoanaerobaculia bacterium]|nr:hypothetical protein [Thermoanaerobaculia bacterium]